LKNMTSNPLLRFSRPSTLAAVFVALLAGLILHAPPLGALDELAGEKGALKSCEERICLMLLQKNPKGADLQCDLTKTWGQSTIRSAESRTVRWGFGDARCTLKLNITRAQIVLAMTEPDFKFHVPAHTAECIVEEGGVAKPLRATLAPKIIFKDGQAAKVWINLMSLEGSAGVKETLRAAAQLEDSLGLFQRPILKSINRFIYRYCPKHYPQAQAAEPPPPAKPGKKLGG
jgi:hypothetical protein